MREIKFRGRRMDNMEWVIGSLVIYGLYPKIFTLPKREQHEVSAETVGQYTGLKDKNGKEIYEGDIISLVTADYETITIVCKFGKVQRQIFENLVEITGFYFVRSNDGRKTFPIVNNYLGKHDTEIWEVIGNIHDNPELLEDKA